MQSLVDLNISVPTDIQEYRDEVRLASDSIENQISQVVNLDAFKTLFETPVDGDGIPTGNAPIYDWPETI